MASLPIADWHSALAEMETALDNALTALARYQVTWDNLLAVRGPSQTAGQDALRERLEARLREWDARLTAAAELAAVVEGQLSDREAAVGRWHESFTGLQEVIEREVGGKGASVPSSPAS